MNKIHKSIWNEQTQTFVAVNELARARGKKSSAGGRLIAAAAFSGISGIAMAGALDGGNFNGLGSAVAYGPGANASSDGATVVGSSALGSAADATAVGHQSRATGTNSTAIGNQVEAAGDGSIAIQGNAGAEIAVDAASARGIAIGQNSSVSQSTSAIAFGDGASTSTGSNDSVAVGRLANITGSPAAIAIGSDSRVNSGSTNSIAFGKGTSVTGSNAVAVGPFAGASATQATAVGAFAQAAQGAFAAGSYAGASGTNAVAIGSQTSAAADGSIAIQGNPSAILAVDAPSVNAISIGGQSTIRQSDSAIAIGAYSQVNAGSPSSIAIGRNARVTPTTGNGTDAIAVGHGAVATATQAVVLGSYSQAAQASTAVGSVANATGVQSVAIGSASISSTQGATAVGQGATAAGARSTILGSNAFDSGVANTTLLGANTSATAGATSSVAIGDSSTVARANAVSIGNATTTRQLVNLGAGTASTDGVNVSQLTGVLNALGGGAGVNPVTGVVMAPAYTVGGTTVNNVGAALSNLDARTSQNTTNISNLVAGQVPDAVKYDSAAHSTVTLGNAGTPVAVKNVAAGTAATDAVNKGQLDGVQSTLTTSIGTVDSKVGTLGTSTAAALGGGATANPDGSITAPSYSVGGTTVRNVGAAISNLDGRTTQNTSDIGSVTAAVNGLNGQMADAVKYDSAAHNAVTLGAAGTPVAVKNVAAGIAATDAVNKGQLDGVQSSINTTVNNLTSQVSDAVKYDSPAHNSVTLGAAGTPVAVKNVAAGAAATDAVNKSQLDGVQSTLTTSIGAVDTKVNTVDTKVSTLGTSTAAALGGGATANPDGSITPPSYSVGGTTVRNVGSAITNLDGRTTQNTNDIGNITTAVNGLNGQMADAVKYDSAAHNSVTLGAAGTPVAVKNIAAGTATTDAVNKGQLDGVQSSLTTSIGAVDTKVGALGTSTAAALGGAATANPDGSITPPSYSVGGTTVRNVGAAISNLDGRTTQNTSDIGSITTAVNGLNGQMADAVKYDSAAHNSVTLGAAGTPVAVKNIAAGTAATDAVNKSQLDGVQSTLTTSIGAVDTKVNTVDTKVGALGTSTAAALGGGATANPDGSVTPPSYSVGGTTVNNVGSAITNLDGRTTQNTSDIGSITTAVNGLNGQMADAVKYDSTAHNSVTLGAAGTPVAVKNVAAGTATTDAVNKGQLDGVQSSLTTSIGTVDTKVSTLGTSTAAALGGGATANPDGSITPPSYSVGGTTVNNVGGAISNLDGRTTQNTSDIGNITTAVNGLNGQMADAVKYDSAAHNSVTLGAAGTPVAVKNIAAGTAATDAVNKSQLDGVQSTLTTSIGTVDTKVGALGTSTAAALGGGATANPDGSITPPSYSVGGSTVNNVGSAISNLDGRTTQNTSDIGNITTTINGLNGQMADAVKYDSAAHNSVTLGAAGTPVAVKNVAAGAAATDAVNKSQLDGVQSTLTTSIGTVDTKVNTVDTKVSALGTSTAAALGGGATANPDGSITPPSYSVGGTTVNNVGSAITNLDGRTAQNTNDIGNITTAVNGLNGQMADAVKYDSPTHDSVTLGNANTPVAVKNVAAGTTTTDAVNKGQLDGLQSVFNTSLGAVDTRVNNLGASTAAALGGGAIFNPNGSITPPSYVVGGTSVANVGAALSNLDARTTQNTNNISNLVLTGQVMDAVKYDSLAHTAVTLGATGTPVTVKNVAAGTAATDAVNKGQLDSVQSTLTTSIGTVDTKVGTLGTSTAAALGGGATANPDGSITPPSYAVGGTTVASVGSAISNLDGRTTQNTNDIGSITTAVNGLNGQIADAIKYDSAAHNSVTLGAAGTPVAVRNIAAGTTATDAVNKGQLDGVQSSINTTVNNLSSQVSDAVKYDSAAHNSVTLGAAGTPVAVKNIAAGAATTDAVNKGQLDSVQSSLTTSIGTVDTKVGTLSTSTAAALGGGATANPDGSITPPSYAVGGTTVASVGAAITNIDGRTTRNTSDISNITTTINNLSGQASDAVRYDSAAHSSVTLGNANAPVAIRNVAAGWIGLGSTDAVNGAQLYAVSGSIATALGGGAAMRPDGTIGAPAFVVAGTTYNSVDGALSGLGSRVASIDNRVTTVEGSVTNVTNQISNGQASMVKQDVATRSINIGRDSDGGIVDVSGSGGARVVSGVQAGTLSATSTDAVNGSQLNATNVRVTSIEQSFDVKLSKATGAGYVQVDGKSDGSDKAAVTAGTGAVAIGSNASASAGNSVAIGANSVANRASTVSIGAAGNERILANVADAVENTDAINKRTMEQAIQSATTQTIQQVSHQISDIRSMVGDVGRKAFAGVAGTAALSMIPDVDAGKNLAIGVGTAQYQGYMASAVGISARINDRLKIKTGASISASGNVYGAGASYQW